VTRLFTAVLAAGILGVGVTLVVGQGIPGGPPATPAQPSTNRPAPPVRDSRTPGYVTATNATELADGTVPPVTATGNFILGPTHPTAAEVTVQPGVPRGAVHDFTMNSADSKIYPGIARAEGTRPMVDPKDPAKRIVTSGPAPYTRRVAVYVPQQYMPGTVAPFIIGADGPDPMLFTTLDNLIAQKRVPVMIANSIPRRRLFRKTFNFS
jgi:iron(III)-enterobactin esterase